MLVSEVGHVYMLWSHRGDLLREKQCDEILDIDFYEKSLQIVSIEDLHSASFSRDTLAAGSLMWRLLHSWDLQPYLGSVRGQPRSQYRRH